MLWHLYLTWLLIWLDLSLPSHYLFPFLPSIEFIEVCEDMCDSTIRASSPSPHSHPSSQPGPSFKDSTVGAHDPWVYVTRLRAALQFGPCPMDLLVMCLPALMPARTDSTSHWRAPLLCEWFLSSREADYRPVLVGLQTCALWSSLVSQPIQGTHPSWKWGAKVAAQKWKARTVADMNQTRQMSSAWLCIHNHDLHVKKDA